VELLKQIATSPCDINRNDADFVSDLSIHQLFQLIVIARRRLQLVLVCTKYSHSAIFVLHADFTDNLLQFC